MRLLNLPEPNSMHTLRLIWDHTIYLPFTLIMLRDGRKMKVSWATDQQDGSLIDTLKVDKKKAISETVRSVDRPSMANSLTIGNQSIQHYSVPDSERAWPRAWPFSLKELLQILKFKRSFSFADRLKHNQRFGRTKRAVDSVWYILTAAGHLKWPHYGVYGVQALKKTSPSLKRKRKLKQVGKS